MYGFQLSDHTLGPMSTDKGWSIVCCNVLYVNLAYIVILIIVAHKILHFVHTTPPLKEQGLIM